MLISTAEEVKLDYGTVIYYLIQDDKVVYVGSTNNLLGRLSSHTADTEKVFERCLVDPVNDDSRYIAEAREILRLDPMYNKNIPAQEKFVTFPKLKRLLLEIDSSPEFKRHIHLTRLKNIITDLNIEMIDFRTDTYIVVNDISSVYQDIISIIKSNKE